jgi:hypothetical protein
MSTKPWMVALGGLGLLALLAVAGHSLRQVAAGRCALDGNIIPPIYRVRVQDGQGQNHEFCCLRCAELWLGRQHVRPRAVFVTDEVSGREVPAAEAFFVRSTVITAPTTGNRIHAFASKADAERHAALSVGRILNGPDRPFAGGD